MRRKHGTQKHKMYLYSHGLCLAGWFIFSTFRVAAFLLFDALCLQTSLINQSIDKLQQLPIFRPCFNLRCMRVSVTETTELLEEVIDHQHREEVMMDHQAPSRGADGNAHNRRSHRFRFFSRRIQQRHSSHLSQERSVLIHHQLSSEFLRIWENSWTPTTQQRGALSL